MLVDELQEGTGDENGLRPGIEQRPQLRSELGTRRSRAEPIR